MSKFNWDEFEQVGEVAPIEGQETMPVEEEQDSTLSLLKSLGLGAAQGASFNFADEAEALVRSELSDTRSYDGLIEEIRNRYKGAEEVNPGTFLTGELVGGVVTPAPIAGAVLRGAKGADKVRKLAQLGAAGGALSGAGASEDNVAEDVLAGAAGGAILAPVIGAGLPAAVGKAAEVAQQGRLGRSITKIYDGVKDAVEKRMADVKEAVAAGKSDVELDAIKNAPKFADRSYYKKEMDNFTKDTESYVRSYIDPKSEISPVGFKNALYKRAAEVGEKSEVKVKTDDIVSKLSSDTNVSDFQKAKDDVLEIIGTRRIVDEQGAATKSTKKLQNKIASEQKKIDAALRDEAVLKAKQVASDLKVDPTAPYKASSDTWMEGQRVKLTTKIINNTRKEIDVLADSIKNPAKYADDLEPASLASVIEKSSNRFQKLLDNKFKLKDLEDIPKLVSRASEPRIQSLNDTIKNTYKIERQQDPDTNRTLFVGRFQDLDGNDVTKAIPTKENFETQLGMQRNTLDDVKTIASDLYKMMKESIEDLGPISIEQVPGGGKLLSAELKGPKGTKVLTETVAPTESLPVTKVPALEELGYGKIQELSNELSKMIGDNKYPREVINALRNIKGTLSNAKASNEDLQSAVQRANDFIKLETEGGLQGLLSGTSVKDLNTLRRTDLPRAGVEITQQGRNLRSKIISAAAREAGPDKSDLNIVQEALTKAKEEFGMSSTLNKQLTDLRSRGEDLELLTSLYDRQELPGGVEAMFQRLGMSPTSWILHGARVAGDVSGKASAMTKGTMMGNLSSKLISMNPDQYRSLAQKSNSPILKSYLNALADADGPKRKALTYMIIQNPATRDMVKAMLPDAEMEEGE